MGAKKQVDDAYTGTGNTIIDEHITVLSNQARDLKDNLEKIDKEFDNNRGKLASIEVEDKNCRKQLAQALEIAKNAWDPSTGIKTRQRNLVKKQQQLEEQRNTKWAEWQSKNALARELQSLVKNGTTYGYKRPTPTPSITAMGPPSKQRKMIDGWFTGEGSEKLPSFTKKGARTASVSSTDEEFSVKPEDAGEVKKEENPESSTTLKPAAQKVAKSAASENVKQEVKREDSVVPGGSTQKVKTLQVVEIQ